MLFWRHIGQNIFPFGDSIYNLPQPDPTNVTIGDNTSEDISQSEINSMKVISSSPLVLHRYAVKTTTPNQVRSARRSNSYADASSTIFNSSFRALFSQFALWKWIKNKKTKTARVYISSPLNCSSPESGTITPAAKSTTSRPQRPKFMQRYIFADFEPHLGSSCGQGILLFPMPKLYNVL